jgi:hypothetical protein
MKMMTTLVRVLSKYLLCQVLSSSHQWIAVSCKDDNGGRRQDTTHAGIFASSIISLVVGQQHHFASFVPRAPRTTHRKNQSC